MPHHLEHQGCVCGRPWLSNGPQPVTSLATLCNIAKIFISLGSISRTLHIFQHSRKIIKLYYWTYRVFIKYCVFFEDFKIYSGPWPLSVSPRCSGVSVCTQWQVKHQRCSRSCRVQKNHNILRKDTIFNEHTVFLFFIRFSWLRAEASGGRRVWSR